MLGDVGRIVERSVARMQEVLPSYARVPREELVRVTLADTRGVLEAVSDPEGDRWRAGEAYREWRDVRARQGITGEEMLQAWAIGLDVLREAACVVAEERGIG